MVWKPREVRPGNTSVINIALQPGNKTGEFLVLADGVQKKYDLTVLLAW